MQKYGIDQQGLINMFAEATAKQGEQVRKTVYEATLKALQGRELTLQNIRTALKSVTQAINAGAAKNALPEVDVESMIGQAIEGMDDALLKAVAGLTADDLVKYCEAIASASGGILGIGRISAEERALLASMASELKARHG